MDIPSHIVKAGDVITLKENKSKKSFLKALLKNYQKWSCRLGCRLIQPNVQARF